MKTLYAIMTISLFQAALAADFHVSPAGNDANSGTADKPFLTLERARDAARAEKGSTVRLAPGTYPLRRTLALDERDSGTRYLGNGSARVTGGLAVPAGAVRPVADPAILQRLLPEVRGKVLEIDLRALGVADFGLIGPRGFGRPYVAAPLEILVDDEPLALSQWPKPGQPGEPIGKVLDPGAARRTGNVLPHGGTFEFATDRPLRWAAAGDVWITGFFMHGYADDTVRVKAFDLQKKTITTEHPHGYGFGSGKDWNRWTALNLLEEIALPGEYMADQKNGKVYFLPPTGKDVAKCQLEVTMLKDPLVAIEGATGVVFDGVNFEGSRGLGIYIERGADNRIQNATLRNLGMVAVCIGQGLSAAKKPAAREMGSMADYLYAHSTWNRLAGTGQGVVNCRIYNIGSGAVSLGGGDRLTLVPAGNFVENCEIHHFNRWDRTYRTAVNIDGVGNAVRHCLVHDCPGGAFLLHGNEHVIEYNEVHHALTEGDDMGALYTGRDPTERGNIIRFNYWHDLAPNHRTHCMYFDDTGGDGTTILGNVFCRAGNNDVLFIKGGSDFTIENNIFIDCNQVLRLNGLNGTMRWLTQDGRFDALMKAVNYNQSPWKERYPEFQDYVEARKTLPRRRFMKGNLIVNSKFSPGNTKFYHTNFQDQDNWSTANDPGFVDMKNGNYALKPDAEAFKKIPGFKSIPFDQIGLKR
jgi:hypothetical protein